MNLIYRCKHRELTGGIWVKEPMIPISLNGKEGLKVNFNAILDSGSDFVLIPLEVAEVLGLKINKRKKEQAKFYSGSTLSTTQSSVTMSISKLRNPKITFKVKCMVLLNKDQQHDEIILGSSFFEKFKIIFDYPNNRFQIKG